MIEQKTKDLIDEAVMEELNNAINSHGTYFTSKHQLYAVLKEELEEVREILFKFKSFMHIFWLSVRGKEITEVKHYTDKKHLEIMSNNARLIALEACQVAAVCEKAIDSIVDDKLVND